MNFNIWKALTVANTAMLLASVGAFIGFRVVWMFALMVGAGLLVTASHD